MQVIMCDAGNDFADEVAHWVRAGLRIVTSDPHQVVLEEPRGAEHHANRGHWRGLCRMFRARPRTVTIAIRRPAGEEDPTTALPAPPAAGYGAAWQ